MPVVLGRMQMPGPVQAAQNHRIRCVVLDFDGTLTDKERESEPFLDRYQAHLARTLGTTVSGLGPLWEQAARTIRAFPERHGYEWEGRITAPAHGDPYLMARAITLQILRSLPHFPCPNGETALLDTLFEGSYDRNRAVFREDAATFLLRLLNDFPVCIATNTSASMVRRKLGGLGAVYATVPVYDGTRKYALEDGWEEVPESVRLTGFQRPVYLRRRDYNRVLERIRTEQGIAWQEMLVIGDVYELDLSLPHARQSRIGLLPWAHTPAHEKAAVGKNEKGFVADSLDEALEKILERR